MTFKMMQVQFRMQLFIFHISQHTATNVEFLLAKVVCNFYDSIQYTTKDDMIHITFKT